MQTTIKEVSPVEYELEIKAEADDLAQEINTALRAQRARTQMKGFRPGKVPLGLVKKVYGKALAYEIAEKTVQQTFESEVLESDEYKEKVLGQPQLTELEYEMDSDLRAIVRFGVRPEVELQDLSKEKISKLVHEVSDEDVERELENIRRQEADLTPVEDEGAGEEDQVVLDLQRLDDESGTPIVGEKEEDVAFFLDDENVFAELKDAVRGKKAGETVQVDLPHGSGEHTHTHRYEVTVKEVKRRELPELDDEFVKEVTNGEYEDVASLREALTDRIKETWEGRSRELVQSQIVERMLKLHPVPVPASAVELYLDSFVNDVRQRNKGELPEGFDEATFRQASRGEAEQQARWMLVRDAFVEQEGLEVSDEDLDAFFEEAAGNNDQLSPEMLRQYYQSLNMLDQVRQQKLSEKVFDALLEKFEVEEKDKEAFERDLEARAETEAAEPEAASAAEESDESEDAGEEK